MRNGLECENLSQISFFNKVIEPWKWGQGQMMFDWFMSQTICTPNLVPVSNSFRDKKVIANTAGGE